MSAGFHRFLLEHYPVLRQNHPTEGRRATRLLAADAFFSLDASARAQYAASPEPSDLDLASSPSTLDPDPSDALLPQDADADTPGIVVRTDFTNDDAWSEFIAALTASEHEFLSDAQPSDPPTANADDDDSSSEDEDEPSTSASTSGLPLVAPTPSLTFFTVLSSPPSLLNGLPNIALLRLLTSLTIRPAPAPPPGTKRLRPNQQHRLIDLNGLQEIYTGRSVWVYDAQSNVDGAVRMVNLAGDANVYGTATGDSWRVRATHITEMQANITFHGMKVDFGGLDRWDYAERVRNLEYVSRIAVLP
ncbi:hypothetical protein OF83DRAFT_1164025 [Amylostereum chailletii]|nr:hypothetical protein OF83DRAFT_1164025 [Amylostereum chailletii]